MRNHSVLIDLYKLKDLYTGLGQFSLNFATEAAHFHERRFRFNFLTPDGIKGLPKEVPVIRAGLARRYLPALNRSFDLWHSLHQFPAHLPARGTRHLITIHDLNFLTEKRGAKAEQYLRLLQQNINKSSAITTISEYTRKHLLEFIDVGSKQVYVIHNGVRVSTERLRKPAFDIGKKFFFSLGVFKSAKNFEVLLPLMKQFPDHQLIIAGNHDTEYGNRMKTLIKEAGMEAQVVLPGPVAEEEKCWLYQQSEAFLFPSRAEGFGLPVIEAMLFGKPVFLSRFTCLPEIGGDKAWYFENFEQQPMAELIRTGIGQYNRDQEGTAQSIKRYAQGFAWEQCIQKYLDVYEAVLAS